MSDLARLAPLLGALKRTKRTGWLDRGVPPDATESVADHAHLTSLIAWLAAFADPALDSGRVLELAVIHDLAEALYGDAPPYGPEEVPDPADAESLRAFFSMRHLRSPAAAAAKHAGESAAFAELAALMPAPAREHLTALWTEYEDQATDEARFVKQVDRLEAFLQARVYAAIDPDLPLWGFTDMAEKEIDHPVLAAIRDAHAEREG